MFLLRPVTLLMRCVDSRLVTCLVSLIYVNTALAKDGEPPVLTAAQQACFADLGLPIPAPGSGRPERLDRETREKLHSCLKENGMSPPRHPELNAAQKKCFTDNGLPVPSPGSRPPRKPDLKVVSCLKENGLLPPPPPPAEADGEQHEDND